jgi:hypothetical protein
MKRLVVRSLHDHPSAWAPPLHSSFQFPCLFHQSWSSAGSISHIVFACLFSVKHSLLEEPPRTSWVDAVDQGGVTVTTKAVGGDTSVERFATQFVVYFSVSKSKGQSELEIHFVDTATTLEVVPTQTSFRHDLTEFCEHGVQPPMKVLTFVKRSCRPLVKGSLGLIVGVVANGHPRLFSSAGSCIENGKGEVPWTKTEATEGIRGHPVHAADDSRKHILGPTVQRAREVALCQEP